MKTVSPNRLITDETKQTLLEQLRARTLEEFIKEFEGLRLDLARLVDPCRVLRAKEIAALLGVHVVTVRKWEADGRLPKFIRLGPGVAVMRATDLIKFLDAKQSKTA